MAQSGAIIAGAPGGLRQGPSDGHENRLAVGPSFGFALRVHASMVRWFAARTLAVAEKPARGSGRIPSGGDDQRQHAWRGDGACLTHTVGAGEARHRLAYPHVATDPIDDPDCTRTVGGELLRVTLSDPGGWRADQGYAVVAAHTISGTMTVTARLSALLAGDATPSHLAPFEALPAGALAAASLASAGIGLGRLVERSLQFSGFGAPQLLDARGSRISRGDWI